MNRPGQAGPVSVIGPPAGGYASQEEGAGHAPPENLS
jgi:hypothetical protein